MLGGVAVVLIVITLGALVYSIYRASGTPEFRMQGFPTALSKDVVAVVNGYERRESDGERTLYYIRADKAVSYADNHQELENVFLEVFSEDGSASDKIAAQKAVYVPAENKNFTAYFAGSVNIDTRDRLSVKTEQLTYTRETETATAEEAVEFARDNVRGRSVGAVVKVRENFLELLNGVEIQTDGEGESSVLKAAHASYDQDSRVIELTGDVNVTSTSPGNGGAAGRSSNLSAGRAVAHLAEQSNDVGSLSRVELFQSVQIASREGELPATRISSNYALYDSPADRFELREAVHIITSEGSGQAEARGHTAVYDQRHGKIDLTGGASVAQTTSYAQGDRIHAQLNAAKKLTLSELHGNALVKQSTPERTVEVTGGSIRANFDDAQSLRKAVVSGSGRTVVKPATAAEYTQMTMAAERSIDVDFLGEGLLGSVKTAGRTTLNVEVPNKSAEAANKSLTADSVESSFGQDGRSLSKAVAAGNAELVVAPLNAAPANYKTTINAPRFDCDFFTDGNNPRACRAGTKTRTTRVPTQPAADRGVQNISSDNLHANFSPQTRDLDRLEAVGNAEFSELDRRAAAQNITYTTSDTTVRLRGGEPVVWDGKARAKAPEIDWNTGGQFSELRGGASTTYYSPKSTGGAAPFGRSEKPVYVTAQAARFDHRAESAVFTGNARGWQDKNYVRGERLTISERDGTFVAEENVQSSLYEAERWEKGISSNQPVFAAAKKLTYNRTDRTLRYHDNVDIRQGKDRMTGGTANILLSEANEPIRTEIEGNVVIVQPNRKAVADFVRYETATEALFLRGRPAQVEDAEQGRSQAPEISVNLKENRFVGEAPVRAGTGGRTRSVYKVRNQ